MKMIGYKRFGMLLLCYFNVAEASIVDSNTQQTSRFRVTNQCSVNVWIQQDYTNKTNDPIVVLIPAGKSYDYTIPDIGLAATRFWPKSGCNNDGYDCTIGESTGVPTAIDQKIQKGPFTPDLNSKFEATWGCLASIYDNNPSLCAINPSDPSKHIDSMTWWNASAVDGYTFPYAIRITNANKTCLNSTNGAIQDNPGVNCSKLSLQSCPKAVDLSTNGTYKTVNGVDITKVNLQWIDPTTKTLAGCFSPCSKLTTAQGSDNGQTGGGWSNFLGGLTPSSPEARMYCCPTPPVSPQACSAGPGANNAYTQSIHTQQQCDAYAYAYDDANSLGQCGAQTRFEFVLCPNSDNPKPTPTPTPTTPTAVMQMIIPNGETLVLNGVTLANGQQVTLSTGSVYGLTRADSGTCTVLVDAQANVAKGAGALCARFTIDNSKKTITYAASNGLAYQVQFNLNTSVGITAYLNNTPISNAQPIDASGLPGESTLYAYQGSKQASCALTPTADTVVRGGGELCNRLNIVKTNKVVNIYLPTEIPDMPPQNPTPQPTPYVVFGMDASEHAKFMNSVVSNGTEVALSSLGKSQQIPLIAYQGQNSASCMIGKTGNTLSIVPQTGALCSGGLVLMMQNKGNYYIGLPNPLPVSSNSQSFGLGIPMSMSVTVGSETILWNSANKSASFTPGVNAFQMKGANGVVRNCPVTLSNKTLTWPKDNANCEGMVLNARIIYLPSF